MIPLLILFGVAFIAVVGVGVFIIITLTRTRPVMLIVDGNPQQIDTHAQTVSQLLADANVTLNDGDTVSASLDSSLDVTDRVTVDRARSVFLMVDGATTPLWTPLTNPADILTSAGVTVAADDRIQIDGTDARVADLCRLVCPGHHDTGAPRRHAAHPRRGRLARASDNRRDCRRSAV
ncbi:MAG: ubiquitin-like domain-containing protein [Anaerolineae bacterium]